MTQILFHGETRYLISLGKGKRLDSRCNKGIWTLRRTNFRGYFLGQQITCIATVEQKCLVPSDNGNTFDSAVEFSSTSDSSVLQTSSDDSPEMDERERLRRMRISKANKGNVPWNKGRKHSAEILQRIRERTKLAMQDPKVKMKLVNLGHAQSTVTRRKIGVGVREGWQRRRKRLMVQESCILEWKNMVAEAARKGYAGEDEMQWDFYTILDEKLREEWLESESVEKRKSTPRPKGSKRAPKSPEQRRKISEAISAKWSDPEYRDRVVSAWTKYHGTPNGNERRPRIPSGERPSVKREPMPKKSTEPKIKFDTIHFEKLASTQNNNSAPSYKDPMARSKLEMIKKIREQRAAMEARKKEATERAKLLIAEAEKAAKALEIAALKSPLAQASLLETRKLIAEASHSLAKLDNGQLDPQRCQDEKDVSTSSASVNQAVQMTTDKDGNSKDLIVNGNPVSPNWTKQEDTNFGKLASKDVQNGKELNADEENSEVGCYSPRLTQLGRVPASYVVPEWEVERPLETETMDLSSTSAPKTTKKWLCGKFIEVEE